jgi:hypothetical protein
VDNGFTRTLTSLETPVLDLSTATSVVLKFNSAMQFSDWETINVDVSTDGASNWNNVWWKNGLIGLPQYYVLDLTSHLGGQGNSALRFRYNTFGDPLGYYWQIDNVKLDVVGQGGPPDPGDPPGTATNPHPVDGETGASLDTELIWSIGSDADSHKVYFGMSSPPALQSDQGGSGFDPGPLEGNTTYYWRIDEVNAAGETTGTEWSFTTETGPLVDPPGQASAPAPVDGATGVGVETDLNWTAGIDATSHGVYFGTTNPPAFQTNQVSTSFDPGTLNADTTYFWRVDEVNGGGTTGGGTWSFTTVVPAQDTRIHLSDLEASSIPGARGRWTASVLVSVEDAMGAPAEGVLAEGTWSDGAKGGVSCTTGSGGQCAVQKSSLKSNVTSVTFTLGNLAGVDMVYDAGANTVSEVIVVPQDAPVGNLLPDARDDSFSTTEDTAVSGNAMSNDDQGDAPATVTAYDASTTQTGSVIMGGDGGFTYTPSSGFTGTDSFGYTITDSDGDSASATVTVTVNPASGGGFTLLASPTRNKGIWYSSLSWSGGLGTGQVTITRDGDPVTDSAANDGEWSEEMGKKASGSYLYRVCENDSGGQCAEDSVQF